MLKLYASIPPLWINFSILPNCKQTNSKRTYGSIENAGKWMYCMYVCSAWSSLIALVTDFWCEEVRTIIKAIMRSRRLALVLYDLRFIRIIYTVPYSTRDGHVITLTVHTVCRVRPLVLLKAQNRSFTNGWHARIFASTHSHTSTQQT